MKGALFVTLWLLVLGCTPAEEESSSSLLVEKPRVTEVYQPQDGLLRIGPEPERAIALTDKGHTLILPPAPASPAGLVVFLDGWRVTVSEGPTSEDAFDHAALVRNVGLLRLTTGNPLDFYFEEVTLAEVARRIQTVLEENGLRETPLYFAGLSLGGTRALKLAVFLEQQGDRYWVRPQAVALVDAPLDMVRFWAAEQRALQDAFHPAAADEGRWVSYLLETHLGGTPQDNLDRYITYSPFVHMAPQGGNARHLRDLPVRAYHEPDIDWWIDHRRKSYYQMNSIDLAALINELKVQGNEQAELVTTHRAREGFVEGTSPHTWSIVDNAELVEWFLAQEPRTVHG